MSWRLCVASGDGPDAKKTQYMYKFKHVRHIGLNRLNDIKVNSSYAFLRSYYERLSQPDNLPMQRNSF